MAHHGIFLAWLGSIASAGCASASLLPDTDATEALSTTDARSMPDGRPVPDARSVPDALQMPDARPVLDGVRLPMVVDDYFAASGYMGDGAAGGIDRFEECAAPRPGGGRGHCHRFTWRPGAAGWAGVFWQFPEGNWGSSPGLAVAPGAGAVELYAWGARGGERVTFVAGMSDVDGFHSEVLVTLTATPTRVLIDLSGQPYGSVVGGFGWVASGTPEPDLSFYIDDVIWR
jgi:hypothetical protein